MDHYLNIREIIRRASSETLDLKAFEADEPRKISPFDNMGLLELIVKTGIADAINKQLGGLKGDRTAIAEVIENNVRRKIIKEHLNDPAFYEKMSTLLDEIIAARKAKAIEYEEYLKWIAEDGGVYHVDGDLALATALEIDAAVKRTRPDGWRGIQAREQVIKAALFDIWKDRDEVERTFKIIFAQREY